MSYAPIAAACAALGLVVGMALQSGACSCGFDEAPIRPEGGELAPRNTLVWIPANRAERLAREFIPGFMPVRDVVSPTKAQLQELIVLQDPAGASLSYETVVVVSEEGQPFYYVLRPANPLDVGTHALGVGPQAETTIHTFEVGDFELPREPGTPVIEGRQKHRESGERSSCGEARAESFTLEHGAAFTVVHFGSEVEFDAEASTWSAVFFGEDKFITVGALACSRQIWDYDDGPALVRFAAMDLAGNSSQWTEPELSFVEEPGCGCQLPGSRQSPPAALAFVASLLLLRIRSSRAAPIHRATGRPPA